MGQFLAFACVINAVDSDVKEILRQYVINSGGVFEPADLTIEDDDCAAISTSLTGVTVMIPTSSLNWDAIAQYLSEQLKTACFSFHIHDSDLWMYVLYERGEIVDQFNPIPDYWSDELSDEEMEEWQGDASVVARCVSRVAAADIQPYLTRWDLDVEERVKARADDEYFIGDDWQLVDFMRRLGFVSPLGGDGRPVGNIFRLVIPQQT